MNRFLFLCFCLLWSITALAHPFQDNKQQKKLTPKEREAILNDRSRPNVRLLPLPPLASPVEPALTADEEKHILRLIAQLADIEDPDYGLSPTMSGHNFAPVSGSESASAFVLTNHNLKQSQAMLELVKLGPRTLPLLLSHLQDATPTKLILQHNRGFGGMGFGHEIDFNAVNPIEQTLRDKARKGFPNLLDKPLTTYQVKVGDVCFSIVGQIVGRGYLAVRYQPTAIIIINSTVADTDLAQEVRSVWAGETPTDRLFHSLLTDYSCRGINTGVDIDDWYTASGWQCEAVLRLLYYFPTQTVPLVVRRLHSLQVQFTGPAGAEVTDKQDALWRMREQVNGVHTEDYVKAVSWCPDPRIQAEMAAIVRRTGDANVMAEAVRGIAPSERKRLTPAIQKLLHAEPPSLSGWHYDSYLVLEALALYWGADARPIFEAYLRQKDPIHLNTVCAAFGSAAFRGAKKDWTLSLLRPLLSDKRPIRGLGHWTNPKGDGRQILTRVCDAAAQALTTWHANLKFEMDQPTPLLDKQITAIQAQVKH